MGWNWLPFRRSRPSGDEAVAALVEEFTEALRRGEAPDIAAYAQQHPEHADELKRLLPAVQFLIEYSELPVEPGEGRES